MQKLQDCQWGFNVQRKNEELCLKKKEEQR